MTDEPATVPASSQSAPPATADPLAPLSRLWYVTIPRALDRISTVLADQAADGVWTASIRQAGALAPLAALLLGFVVPHTWPGIEYIYTESLLFLVLATAIGVLSGTAGIALAVGYVVADLLSGGFMQTNQNALDRHLGQVAGHAVTDLLLFALVVAVPNLARRMAEEIDLPFEPDAKAARLGARAALFGVAAGVLTYLWCQAMIVLVRPPFVWAHDSPTFESVAQVQDSWPLIAGVAVVAAVVRIVAEQRRAEQPRHAAPVVALLDARWAPPLVRGVSGRFPPIVRIAAVAALMTFLLAGMYEAWIDPLFIFAAVFALGAWRSDLFFRAPPAYVELLDRIPSLVRLVAAVIVGYVVAQAVMSPFYDSGDLHVVLIGALVTFLVLAALFPGPRRSSAPAAQPRASVPA